MFFNWFWPKSNWSTKHFLFDLNLELHSGLKVRGSEINFINKKLLKSKNPRGFVIPVLKVEVTNPRGFFDSSNFLLIKLISDPLTLRPLCSSRFRLNKKCLADQLLLGQNLLKNVLNRKTFLNWRPLILKEKTNERQCLAWNLNAPCGCLAARGHIAGWVGVGG